MKKIVFAAVLAFSAAASASFTTIDLPSLWWPDEFTGSESKAQADAQTIVDSKNVQAYLKKNKLGPIVGIMVKGNKSYQVFSEACSFDVVIRANQNPSVLPVKGTLFCD